MIDHEESIPKWVDATNWNARRYFKKGSCHGYFEESIEDDDFHQPDDNREKKIVCGILWYPTRYHELLMYLVAE